jgi:hypothetical protein
MILVHDANAMTLILERLQESGRLLKFNSRGRLQLSSGAEAESIGDVGKTV